MAHENLRHLEHFFSSFLSSKEFWAALIGAVIGGLLTTAFLKQKNRKKMPKSLTFNKCKFPVSALLALPAERRSSLLLLGVLVNETNWPYKLLVKALHSLPRHPNEQSNDPELRTNFALTILLTTTLVGKIHEGWDFLCKGRLRMVVNEITLPDETK